MEIINNLKLYNQSYNDLIDSINSFVTGVDKELSELIIHTNEDLEIHHSVWGDSPIIGYDYCELTHTEELSDRSIIHFEYTGRFDDYSTVHSVIILHEWKDLTFKEIAQDIVKKSVLKTKAENEQLIARLRSQLKILEDNQ